MRKSFSSIKLNSFKPTPKTVLRVMGTATLLGGLLITAAMFLQTSRGAPGLEAVPPQSQVVIAGQHVRFTLYNDGIYPPKATVRAGLVSIGIEDLASANGGLSIERLTTGQPIAVGRVERLRQNLRGRASVDLSPGTYRLRILGSQANEAELTVEP